MRTHHCHIEEISLIDLRQEAMTHGQYIEEAKNTFNNEKVYRITKEVGLFTFDELKQYFKLGV